MPAHHHGHHGNDKVFDPKKAANLDSPERKKRIPAEAILNAARPFPGMRVADVGSGTGYYSFALLNSDTPPSEIDAIDASEEMNTFFRSKLKDHPNRNRVRIHLATGEELPLPENSVDLVVMGNVFHEFENRQAALSQAKRILRPNGRILIIDWSVPSDTTGQPESGPPYNHRIPESEVLRDLTLAGFSGLEHHSGFQETYALSGIKKSGA